MSKIWNHDALQQYIKDETQESLALEYKSADALSKADGKIREISKDVSAMANSSGGIIIYGIKEYDAREKRYLPEKIDPILQDAFSKEWLEQVINNIRPRIDGVIIHPVQIDMDLKHVVYVVEVPQSRTAHQATDHRYYKRYNFQTVPMEDYEVRDTMGRQQNPQMDISLSIVFSTKKYLDRFDLSPKTLTLCQLRIHVQNRGKVYAQYVNGFIEIPLLLVDTISMAGDGDISENVFERDGVEYYLSSHDNTMRDVIESERDFSGTINKYGPSRYAPILPSLFRDWGVALRQDFDKVDLKDFQISWLVFADNAPFIQGRIKVKDIKVLDYRTA